MNVSTNVDDYIVKRGPYADDPRYAQDAHDVFMAEWDGEIEAGETACALWLAEGRTEPSGPLYWDGGWGDRIVPR
jgi:hypothetical protein